MNFELKKELEVEGWDSNFYLLAHRFFFDTIFSLLTYPENLFIVIN